MESTASRGFQHVWCLVVFAVECTTNLLLLSGAWHEMTLSPVVCPQNKTMICSVNTVLVPLVALKGKNNGLAVLDNLLNDMLSLDAAATCF